MNSGKKKKKQQKISTRHFMRDNLKDIVELVVAPVHTDEKICFLDSKISEHQHRFCEALNVQRLTPKHHYIEHYPQLIKAFGPLVSLWTMRSRLNIASLNMLSDIPTPSTTFFCLSP